MEDVLGTGTILRQIIKAGDAGNREEEAPRKFFAVIDIETRLENSDAIIQTESFEDFLISSDVDLFAGAHIVISLMDINEKSRFIFHPKFCYGTVGNLPSIPPNAKLDCTILLKKRIMYDEFVSEHLLDEELFPLDDRLKISNRKRERGNFWFARGDYTSAISAYKSARVLLKGIDKFPQSKIAIHNNLAACFIKQGELNVALKQIEKALKLDPKNMKSLFRKATIETNGGHSKQAIATLQAMLELEPTNKAALDLLEQVKLKARSEFESERDLYKRMLRQQ